MSIEHYRDRLNRSIPTSMDDPQFIQKLRRALHLTIGQTVRNEERIQQLQKTLSATRLEVPDLPKQQSSDAEARLRKRLLRLSTRVESLNHELEKLQKETPEPVSNDGPFSDSTSSQGAFAHSLLEALGKIKHLRLTDNEPLYEDNTATVRVGEGEHTLRISQRDSGFVEITRQPLDGEGSLDEQLPEGDPVALRSRRLSETGTVVVREAGEYTITSDQELLGVQVYKGHDEPQPGGQVVVHSSPFLSRMDFQFPLYVKGNRVLTERDLNASGDNKDGFLTRRDLLEFMNGVFLPGDDLPQDLPEWLLELKEAFDEQGGVDVPGRLDVGRGLNITTSDLQNGALLTLEARLRTGPSLRITQGTNYLRTNPVIDTAQDIRQSASPIWSNVRAVNTLTSDRRIILGGSGPDSHVRSTNYTSGFLGRGFNIDHDGNAEVQNLTVRRRLRAFELLIEQISATKGPLVVSGGGGTVAEVEPHGGREHTITFEERHGAFANDILVAQAMAGGGTDDEIIFHYSIVTVLSTVDEKRLRVKVEQDSTGSYTMTPAEGFDYVQFGNTSEEGRQNVVFLSPFDGGHIDIVEATSPQDYDLGPTMHVRLGRIDQTPAGTAWDLPAHTYGLWSDTTLLDNQILIGDPQGQYLSYQDGTLTVRGQIQIIGDDGEPAEDDLDEQAINDLIDEWWNGDGQNPGIGDDVIHIGNAARDVIDHLPPIVDGALYGLSLGATHMGFWRRDVVTDAPQWRTYMDNDGGFYLGGSSTPSGQHGLVWNDDTLTIAGNINILGGPTQQVIEDATGKLDTIDEGATEGAEWGVNLGNIPGRFGDAPAGTGLFMTGTHMGFYQDSEWRTFMTNDGDFYLGGSALNKGLSWEHSTDTLTVVGTIEAEDGVISGQLDIPGSLNVIDTEFFDSTPEDPFYSLQVGGQIDEQGARFDATPVNAIWSTPTAPDPVEMSVLSDGTDTLSSQLSAHYTGGQPVRFEHALGTIPADHLITFEAEVYFWNHSNGEFVPIAEQGANISDVPYLAVRIETTTGEVLADFTYEPALVEFSNPNTLNDDRAFLANTAAQPTRFTQEGLVQLGVTQNRSDLVLVIEQRLYSSLTSEPVPTVEARTENMRVTVTRPTVNIGEGRVFMKAAPGRTIDMGAGYLNIEADEVVADVGRFRNHLISESSFNVRRDLTVDQNLVVRGTAQIMGGLTVEGDIGSHPDTGGAESVTLSGDVVVSDLTFDAFGHVSHAGVRNLNLDDRFYIKEDADAKFVDKTYTLTGGWGIEPIGSLEAPRTITVDTVDLDERYPTFEAADERYAQLAKDEYITGQWTFQQDIIGEAGALFTGRVEAARYLARSRGVDAPTSTAYALENIGGLGVDSNWVTLLSDSTLTGEAVGVKVVVDDGDPEIGPTSALEIENTRRATFFGNLRGMSDMDIHGAGRIFDGVTSDEYNIATFGGSGYAIQFMTDENGDRLVDDFGNPTNRTQAYFSELVADRLRVAELLVNQVTATGGSNAISDGFKVESVVHSAGDVYIMTAENEQHTMAVGDIIHARRYTNGIYFSYGEITAISGDEITAEIFTAPPHNSDIPEAGFEYVRVGNTANPDRQSLIYLTSADVGAPYIDFFTGLVDENSFFSGTGLSTRLGKLDDLGAAHATGMGLYTDNLRATGDLRIGELDEQADGQYLEYKNGTLTVRGEVIVTGGNVVVDAHDDLLGYDAESLPGGAGLSITETRLGYFAGGAWRTYMNSQGHFFLQSSDLSNDEGLEWDGDTLSITGNVNITGGNAAIDGQQLTNEVAPTGDGLYIGSNRLGYYDSSTWRTYMTNSGDFFLSGSGGHGLEWSSGTLNITGAINVMTPGGPVPPVLDAHDDLFSRPANAEESGLRITDSEMGFYDGTQWLTYMNSAGNFYLGGTGGALTWDGSLLDIEGKINATAGSITGNLDVSGRFDVIDPTFHDPQATFRSLQVGNQITNQQENLVPQPVDESFSVAGTPTALEVVSNQGSLTISFATDGVGGPQYPYTGTTPVSFTRDIENITAGNLITFEVDAQFFNLELDGLFTSVNLGRYDQVIGDMEDGLRPFISIEIQNEFGDVLADDTYEPSVGWLNNFAAMRAIRSNTVTPAQNNLTATHLVENDTDTIRLVVKQRLYFNDTTEGGGTLGQDNFPKVEARATNIKYIVSKPFAQIGTDQAGNEHIVFQSSPTRFIELTPGVLDISADTVEAETADFSGRVEVGDRLTVRRSMSVEEQLVVRGGAQFLGDVTIEGDTDSHPNTGVIGDFTVPSGQMISSIDMDAFGHVTAITASPFGDFDNYYTKSEVNSLISDFVTQSDINSSVSAALTDYYTKLEVDGLIADFLTALEIDNKIDAALLDYYTKLEIDTILEDYVTDDDLDLILDDYYTKAESDARFAELAKNETITGSWTFNAPLTTAAITATGAVTSSATVTGDRLVANSDAEAGYFSAQTDGYNNQNAGFSVGQGNLFSLHQGWGTIYASASDNALGFRVRTETGDTYSDALQVLTDGNVEMPSGHLTVSGPVKSGAQATQTNEAVLGSRQITLSGSGALNVSGGAQNMTQNMSWGIGLGATEPLYQSGGSLRVRDHDDTHAGVITTAYQDIYGTKEFKDNLLSRGRVGHPNWTDGLNRWNVDADGQADFRSIFADELRVDAFVSEVAQAFLGEDIVTKSVATLDQPFVVPAVGQTVSITVEDLAGLDGADVFETADTLRMRVVDTSGGGLLVANIWAKVNTTGNDTPSNGDGTQTWSVEILHNGGATGETVKPGSVVLDYGQPGDAVIERSVISSSAPYNRIYTWEADAAGIPSNFDIQTYSGNLSGHGPANTTGPGFFSAKARLTDNIVIGDLTEQEDYLRYDETGLTVQGRVLADRFELSGENGDFWNNTGHFRFGGPQGLSFDPATNVLSAGTDLVLQWSSVQNHPEIVEPGDLTDELAALTLDEIGDGANFARVSSTQISEGMIQLASVEGNLDDIDEGSTYGRIRSTVITDGKIELSEALGSLDDLEDGQDFAKVSSTQIEAGKIVLSQAVGSVAWDTQIGGPGKPADGADVTDDQFTQDLANIDDGTQRARSGLNSTGDVARVIRSSNLPTFSPETDNLYLTATNFGFFNGSVGVDGEWTAHINNQGHFFFFDPITDNGITFDGSDFKIRADDFDLEANQLKLVSGTNARLSVGDMTFGLNVDGTNHGLELNSNNYWRDNNRFRIGNASNYILWNGSSLEVAGSITVSGGNAATSQDVINAETNARDAARDNVATQLGYVDYNDFQTKASLGTTLIDGGFINTDVLQADAIIANAAAIANWTIGENRLSAANIELHSEGRIRHTGDKWRLNSDGSGQLAGGNVTWDTNGSVNLAGDVTFGGELDGPNGTLGALSVGNTLTVESDGDIRSSSGNYKLDDVGISLSSVSSSSNRILWLDDIDDPRSEAIFEIGALDIGLNKYMWMHPKQGGLHLGKLTGGTGTEIRLAYNDVTDGDYEYARIQSRDDILLRPNRRTNGDGRVVVEGDLLVQGDTTIEGNVDSHPSIPGSISSATTSGATIIRSLQFDQWGHATDYTTHTLTKSDINLGNIPNSTTSSRTSSSTTTLLLAKAMNDHRTSGDHDGRYLGQSGGTVEDILRVENDDFLPEGLLQVARTSGTNASELAIFHSSSTGFESDASPDATAQFRNENAGFTFSTGDETTGTVLMHLEENGNAEIPNGGLNVSGALSVGSFSGTFSGLRAQATTKGDVGLGSVPNWSGSTSTSLGTSNNTIASQGAIKTYVDNAVSGNTANSDNWDTAFDRSPTGLTVSTNGRTVSVTLAKQDGTNLSNSATVSLSTLTPGSGISGSNYNGSQGRTWTLDEAWLNSRYLRSDSSVISFGDFEIRQGQNVTTGLAVRASSNPPDDSAIFAVESSGTATRFAVTQNNGAFFRDNLWVGYTQYDDGEIPSSSNALNVSGSANITGSISASNLHATLSAGTGLNGSNYTGATNQTWSLDTSYTDGRYANLTGDSFTGDVEFGDFLRADINKARFEVLSGTTTSVAMGFLDGLPKNQEEGEFWGSDDRGFWVREGDNLVIDGDVEYENGNWLIENDASLKIQDGITGADIIKLGTDSGDKGLFLYSGTDPNDKLVSLNRTGLTIHATGSQGAQDRFKIVRAGGGDGYSIDAFSTFDPAIDYGDVDGNGDVDSFDAVLVLQEARGLLSNPLTAAEKERANVFGVGGTPSPLDGYLIQEKVVGLLTTFPVEDERVTVKHETPALYDFQRQAYFDFTQGVNFRNGSANLTMARNGVEITAPDTDSQSDNPGLSVAGNVRFENDLSVNGEVSTDYIKLGNHEQNDFNTDGLLFWDMSAGLYIKSGNADDGTKPRLQWSGDNVSAGSNINISYGSEDHPTLSVASNPRFSNYIGFNNDDIVINHLDGSDQSGAGWSGKDGLQFRGDNSVANMALYAGHYHSTGASEFQGQVTLDGWTLRGSNYQKTYVGNFSASNTQAKRYQIARIGWVSGWSGNTCFYVHLFTDYYEPSYKIYRIDTGYSERNSGGYNVELVYMDRGNSVTHRNSRVTADLHSSGEYVRVYVDADYYTRVDVFVEHNMPETSSNPPAEGKVWLNRTAGSTDISSFRDNLTSEKVVQDSDMLFDRTVETGSDLMVGRDLDVAGVFEVDHDRTDWTIRLGRRGGNPSIQSSEQWFIADGGAGDGKVGLNYWASGDVILAYGGGNVGISTASPTEKLDVNGSIRVSGDVKASGDIENFFSSDTRLKDNTTPLDGWGKLDVIDAYNFTWNEHFKRAGEEDFGVIAQEIQEVLPTAVRESGEGWLQVDYAKLSALNLSANKRAKEEILRLQKRVAALEEQLKRG